MQPLEFYLFKQYSVAVKDFLNDTCYLSRYTKDDNVLVIYSTPAKAFAKYIYPIFNGQQIRPTVSFHLSSTQYGQNENNLGWANNYKFNSTTLTYTKSKPLLVYKLTYSLVLRTLLASDMDILIYELLNTASFNNKYSNMVDGQWMEIGVGEPRDETNLEPGDAQDRIIRFGMDLTIPRAYLPREYRDYGSIQEVQFDYNAVSEISEEI